MPTDSQQPSRSKLLIPAVAITLGIGVFWTWILPAQIDPRPSIVDVPSFDLHAYFLPKFVFGTEEVLRGVLPLWNRFEYLGMPFLATAQPSALYLPKLLAFAALDPDTALWVYLIGHYLLLAAFFLLFLRELGMNWLGALAGTACWTFNLPILLSNYHPVRISSIVWIPLLFLLAERIGRSRSVASLAMLAVVVALQVTAGYPEFVLDSALVLGMHALVMHAAGLWRRGPWRTVPLLGTAFLLGGMLAAVQLLPLAELGVTAGRAARATQQSGLEVIADLARRYRVLAIGFPALLGFACVGVGRRSSLGALAGLCSCVIMGWFGWRALRLLPGFSMLRHPLAWSWVVQFFLAWLVACGADRFARADRRGQIGAVSRIVVGLSGLLWAGLCLARALLPQEWWTEASTIPTVATVLGTAGSMGRWAPANGLGLAGGVLLAVAVLSTKRSSSSPILVGSAVTLLVAGQLAAFPFGTQPRWLGVPVSSARFTALAGDAAIDAGRVLSMPDLRYGYPLLDRIESPFGSEGSLRPPRIGRVVHRLQLNLVDLSLDWQALARAEGFLDAINVRYVVAPRRMARQLRRHGLTDAGSRGGSMALFRNGDALGPAWVVHGARTVGSEEEALDHVLAPEFDPRREAILETPLDGDYPVKAALPPTPAVVRRPTPSVTEVFASSPAPGVLVLADACFPGWEARVNGQPAEISCVNYLLRGVELPAGDHTVRFEYRPWPVRAAVGVSALAAIVSAGMLLGGILKLPRGSRRGT